MNAPALTIFKVLRKHFSEEDANIVVESIEQIIKKNIAEQKINTSVERKIKKEHKSLATKEDIMNVRAEIM